MRRVIGMDIHRTFAEVVFWEDGKLRLAGRVSMTRAGLEALGRSLGKEDEVVIEATGNAMAVVRVLSPYVGRVIVANPLQVKAIAHAHVKTDKIDAGILSSLRAADFLPEIWLPDADTERWRRLVARRNQVVRHRTRIKDDCTRIWSRHARIWLSRQIIRDDEAATIDRTCANSIGPAGAGWFRPGDRADGPTIRRSSGCWSKRLGLRPRRQARRALSPCGCVLIAATRLRRSPAPASWPCCAGTG
jgi:transposase